MEPTSFRDAIQAFAAVQTEPRAKHALAKVNDYSDTHPLRARMIKLRLCAKYALDRKAPPGVGGKWTDFLDWLIANGPAILELVMKIIGMFGDSIGYGAAPEPLSAIYGYGTNWDGVWADLVVIGELTAEVIDDLTAVGLSIKQLIAHLME